MDTQTTSPTDAQPRPGPHKRWQRGAMVYTFTSKQQQQDFYAFICDVFADSFVKLTLEDAPPLVRIANATQPEIELFTARALAFLRGYECAKKRVEVHLATSL